MAKETVGRAALGELLFESAATRVWRVAASGDAPSRVAKEYLGPAGARRRLAESATLARLAGVPGIVQRHGPADTAGPLLLRDDGGAPLSEALRQGPLAAPSVLDIAVQLARILAAMHAAGVIHRDLHPSNVLLVPERRRVVLIDFDHALMAPWLPAPREGLVGTLGYTAPELTGRTGRGVDHRADLYGLGATLYALLTGRPPFHGTDALHLVRDQLLAEPMPPDLVDARVPAALSAIVMRLLATAPERRYQGAEGVLHDLEHLADSAGAPGAFPLGERDFPSVLAAPSALIGRDAERAALLAAFERAATSSQRVVLVEGDAGVGKSALVRQLRGEAVAAGGWFVQGKFDQHQRDAAAAGAVVQALRELGRLLLAEPPASVEALRARILAAVGANAALIVRAVPEFGMLLGDLPPLPDFDPREATPRMLRATLDLLGAVASPDRPVVVALDDLQWAGEITLQMLEGAMDESASRGLLVVGAFRPQRLGEMLARYLTRWSGRAAPPAHLYLRNLAPDDARDFIAAVLRLAPEQAEALAAPVFALAGGNPFDTLELLNALRRDGTLRLSRSGWQWEEAAIRRFVGRGNVVDLLAMRIGRLPADTRRVLEVMSCLGSAMPLALLDAACGWRGPGEAADLSRDLAPALDDGLLVAEPHGAGTVGFRHDRVQQAVLALMGAAGRERTQWATARLLALRPAYRQEAATLYLGCAQLLVERDEQREAAALLHAAGRRFAVGSNHALAHRYLGAAARLQAVIDDDGDDHARVALALERHAVAYSLGHVEEMDRIYADLPFAEMDPLLLAEPTCQRIRSLDNRGHAGEALALGRQLLARFGVEVPGRFDPAASEPALDALGEWVRHDREVPPDRRPRISDPKLLAVAKVLSRMARSAYMAGDLPAHVWLTLECQRLWATHGVCPDLVVSLGRFSVALVRTRADYRTGYEVVRHVVAVGEALGYEPQTSEARAAFATYACCWFEPFESVRRQAALALEGVVAGGDLGYACYVHRASSVVLLDIAASIADCMADIEAGIVLCERAGNRHALALFTSERQLLRALAGRTSAPASMDDEGFDTRSFLAGDVDQSVTLNFHARAALLALVMGDLPALREHAVTTMAMLGAEPVAMDAHLPLALAHAWTLQVGGAIPEADRKEALAGIEASRAWLAARAADQPYNFGHVALLVEGEQAWAQGHAWAAARAFDAALFEAAARARPWHAALIAERAGYFKLSRGLQHAGRTLLAQACDRYQAWGATAKVDAMRARHDFLRGRTVPSGAGMQASDEAIDLLGVLRASQALGSETSVQGLAQRVTELVAALSGATHVRVLSWQDGHWLLLAPRPDVAALSLEDAAREGLLPLSAIAYAERTQAPLLVDDAMADARFARDRHFAGLAHCALLVVPIAAPGGARAMLFMENRRSAAAFNARRLDAVMLITGQLAVSLANAQLYESLEQRVQARTRELRETQAQLVATARRAGMAEVANSVLHNVGNVLNSVNVSAARVEQALRESRVQRFGQAARLLEANARDLPAFLTGDPRGRVLPGYLSHLAAAMAADQAEVLAEVERLRGSVDHINAIVATQQSHAGASSLLAPEPAADVLDEALRINAQALDEAGVAVVRRFDGLPAVPLDRTRVLQILVNLIRNAVQAMQDVPAPARQLTLAADVVRSGDRERLRIIVRDEGAGIAPAHQARIFTHGFTTREGGHGFGLHSCAVAAVEMGGALQAHSDGPGRGATFTLELPV